MSTLATDDFNRADSANLGANWTALDTTFAIASNQAAANGAGGVFTVRYTGATFPDDQWAQVTVNASVETQTDQGCGPCVRMQAGGNLYLLQGNTVETRIYKRVSGGYTQLGTDGPSIAAGDVLYLEIQGSQLIAKKNGSTICGSPTDSAIASGNAGLWAGPLNTVNNVDDFSAGDFAAAGPSPGAGRIDFSGKASTVLVNSITNPTAGNIVFTGFAPTVNGAIQISPSQGTIVFTGKAPERTNFVVTSPAQIVFTGKAPSTGAVSIPYITSFPLTENPISEGSVWVLGATDGLAWHDVETGSGNAYGNTTVAGYDDCIAHIRAPTWPANQYAKGTVYLAGGYSPSPNHEIELHLRFQITANNARGYEILWGLAGYIAIVRWEGGLGSFTPLYDPGPGSFPVPVNGDVLKAEIVGSNISVWRNNVLHVTVTDTTWASGQPGMGFWPTTGTTPANFGFSDLELGQAGLPITPDPATIVFSGQAPGVSVQSLIFPTAGSVVFSGKAPSVSQQAYASPTAGFISFTGYAVTVSGVSVSITTALGTIIFNGYAPSVTGGTEIVTTLPSQGVRSRHRRLRVLPDRRIVLADEYETEQLLKLFKVEDIEEITQVPPRKYKKLRDKALPAPDIIAQMREEEDVLYVMKEIARLL